MLIVNIEGFFPPVSQIKFLKKKKFNRQMCYLQAKSPSSNFGI